MSFYRSRVRQPQPVGDRSLAKQSMRDECDINRIVRQYQRTGIVSHIAERAGQFLDLPDACELQTSLEVVRQADEAFAALPSVVRDEFGNSPETFLLAFRDPAKKERLRELGLLQVRPHDVPAATPVPEKP